MLPRIAPFGEPHFTHAQNFSCHSTKALLHHKIHSPEQNSCAQSKRMILPDAGSLRIVSGIREHGFTFPGKSARAVSSAVERHVYTVLVGGSIPSLPILLALLFRLLL